jgi:DNA invertase Pin-like site-specific DNA recombinase
MLERQRDGIAKAKSEGKYKGRPASIDAAEIKRLTATMGPAAIAKHLGISSQHRLAVAGAGQGGMTLGRCPRALQRIPPSK